MRDGAARRRAATFERGHRGEWLALAALMLRGYRPLARRFAAAGGEIDLVMRRGRTIVFVEVKARPTLEAGLASISATKRIRFGRAARAWLARHPGAVGMILRADAVFVAPGCWPLHVPNAFSLGP